MSTLQTILSNLIKEYGLELKPKPNIDYSPRFTFFSYENIEEVAKLKAIACLMGMKVINLSDEVNDYLVGYLADTQDIHNSGDVLKQ